MEEKRDLWFQGHQGDLWDAGSKVVAVVDKTNSVGLKDAVSGGGVNPLLSIAASGLLGSNTKRKRKRRATGLKQSVLDSLHQFVAQSKSIDFSNVHFIMREQV